jgi:diacylglycerol kinase (ATP)
MDNPQWTIKLEWDDGRYNGPVTLVSVGNSPLTGGLFYTVPDADAFDGKLSFVYGYISTRLRLLTALPMLMKPKEGNITEHPACHQVHATWLKVQITPGSPSHTDGEIFATDIQVLEYKVIPACLPIMLRQ